MGPTALLPLRRKCALGIFITHENATFNFIIIFTLRTVDGMMAFEQW
jgi:hypothetical protein